MTSFAFRAPGRVLLLALIAACSSAIDLVPEREVVSAEPSGGTSGASGASGGMGGGPAMSTVTATGTGGTEVTPTPMLPPPAPTAGNAGNAGQRDPTPNLPDAGTSEPTPGCPDVNGDQRCDTCDGVAATLAKRPLYYFSFDEAPGATQAVSAGSVPFSATYMNAPQLGIGGVADGRGTAVFIAANTNFPRVQAINVAAFPSTAITATAWVRTRQPGLYTILSYATADSFNEFGVYINGTGTRVGIESLNFDQELGANRITDGMWHFVAVTWVNDTLQVYFDGEPAGPSLQTTFANANQTLFPLDPGESIDISPGGTLIFGQDQDSLNGGFAVEQALGGGLDEVAIFDRALSGDEVREIFTSTTCGERCDGLDNDGDGVVDEGFLGGSPACPAPSCQAILESGSAFVSGNYFLDNDPNREVPCTFP
jgi:hypothetical protein